MDNLMYKDSLFKALPMEVGKSLHQLSGGIRRLQKTVNSSLFLKLATASHIDTPNLGVAKMNVGPPRNLSEDIKLFWISEINRMYISLIRRFMIPHLHQQISQLQHQVSYQLANLFKYPMQPQINQRVFSFLQQGVEVGHRLTVSKLGKLIAQQSGKRSIYASRGDEKEDETREVSDPKIFFNLPWFPVDALNSMETFTKWLQEFGLSNHNDDLRLFPTESVIDLITPKSFTMSKSNLMNDSESPNFANQQLEDSPMIIDLMTPVNLKSQVSLPARSELKPTTSIDSPKQLPPTSWVSKSTPLRCVSPTNERLTTKIDLNIKNSTIHKIVGDGNCLFRSLSLGISNNQSLHSEMRTKITLFLAQNERRFVPFFYPEKIPGSDVIPKNFMHYVEIVSQDGVYGGALEITAAAEIWSIGIWVFDQTDRLHSVWDELNEDYICLRYTLRRKHYELIEIMGKTAYQILLSSRELRRKMSRDNNFMIDLTTPKTQFLTPLFTPKKLSVAPRFPLDKNRNQIDKDEDLDQTRSTKCHTTEKVFPVPSHDTPLRKCQTESTSVTGVSKQVTHSSLPPLHFERTVTLSPTVEKEGTEFSLDISKRFLKTLKGKKRRTVYKQIYTFFKQQRTKRRESRRKEKGKVLSISSSGITQSNEITGSLELSNQNAADEIHPDFLPSSIFNFSSYPLEPGILQLLSKGLSFSPSTNVVNSAQVKIDLFKFSRNVRLKKFFELHPPKIGRPIHQLDSQYKFNLESNFDPELSCKFLNTYTESIKLEISHLLKRKIKTTDNLIGEERAALSLLKTKISNGEISLVLADKGGGIVILDYQQYKTKGDLYFLENKESYQLITDSEQKILKSLLKARSKVVSKLYNSKVILLKHKKFVGNNLFTKITGIKFLFKVHKTLDFNSMPLRPIHPSIGSPNHNLSLLLDALISPYVNSQTLPAHLRDTNQLLFFLRNLGPLPKNTVIVTSDITALYTNIPHKQGLEILHQFLLQNSDYPTASVSAITQAVKHVVSLNFLRWQNSIYQQIRGVAMGTPLAVSYANIFMGAVDAALALKAPFIIKHFRFIDDNFFLLPSSKVLELQKLSNDLGFPTIKSTWTVDTKNLGISFLDVWMSIKDDVIHTRLFTKPTDRHLYLHPSSYHPRHVISNIPYSILSRVRRLCSDEHTYLEDKIQAIRWLVNRGYEQASLISIAAEVESRTGMEHILAIERKYQNNTSNTGISSKGIATIPLTLTYNSKFKQAPSLLFKHRHTLAATLKQPHRTLVAFRRNKNLTDILVHPSYRKHFNLEQQEERYGFHHCKKNLHHRLKNCICGISHAEGCRLCAHSVDGLNRLPKSNVKVMIGQFADCHTRNVVYAIWCRICTKVYVGETTQPLSKRFDQHLRLMKTSKSSETLYKHFRVHHPSNAFVVPLEVIKKLEPKLLQIKESKWINKLESLSPNGLNTQLDLDQRYIGGTTKRSGSSSIFTPTPIRARAQLLTPNITRSTNGTDSHKRDSNRILTPKKRPSPTSSHLDKRSRTEELKQETPKQIKYTPKCTGNHNQDMESELEPFVAISPYITYSSKRKGRHWNLSSQRIFNSDATNNQTQLGGKDRSPKITNYT